MQIKLRTSVVAGAVLIGAGVVAVAPAGMAPARTHGLDIALTAGEEQNIVIDIVRHGQRMPPHDQQDTESPPHPGAPLSDLGHQQAQDVGNQLYNELGPHVAGVFSGQALRDTQTAAPFAEHVGTTPQILPGIDEIDPGIYGSHPDISLSTLTYELTTLLWAAGLELLPIPHSVDTNGVVFDAKFTAAVDTMYQAALDNPVVSKNGEITDVAFNNEESIVVWMLMNVKNPTVEPLLADLVKSLSTPTPGLLSNGGIVEFDGNPQDGWNLVSWDGIAVSQHPGLPTELYVDLRDLIQAPQAALWSIYQAALTADPASIQDALQAGLHSVGAALVEFPESVIHDIVGAL